ncbi:MAG: hypothetical protein PUP93_26545 [Rhizonema sp. NSF051]|nr:hypothetical protein [Rhizonema sp. NSF051]
MNIAEAAEKLRCNANVLINEMRKKYPGKPWKPDTELPQEFVDEMLKHTNEYLKSDGLEPIPMDPEITKTKEAITLSEETLHAIEYGILEALSSQKIEIAQFFGTSTALKGIQAFEDVHAKTWELYLEQKSEIHNSEIQKIESKISENAFLLVGDLLRRQESLTKLTAESQKKTEEMRRRTQVLVDAFIKPSTF